MDERTAVDALDPSTPARSIGEARPRGACDLVATVISTSCTPGSIVALDVLVGDGTGTLLCHFTGRRAIPGVVVGTQVRLRGTLTAYRSRLCLLNPAYELLDGDSATAASS